MNVSPALKHLVCDHKFYAKAFNVFLKCSQEHECMVEFFDKELADVLARIGNGKSSINVLGIGSGPGEMDLHMLRKIQAKHPGVHINNDVVDPSSDHVGKYKELISKTQNLENVSFNWNQMSSQEYELQIKEKNENKKWDFIHMIQVLYYIQNFEETLNFFLKRLEKNGRMLIILISGNSGWTSLDKKFGTCLPLHSDTCAVISSHFIKDIVQKMGMKCQHYDLPSVIDITTCFNAGSEEGSLLLDFVTQTIDFSKSAPPSLKAEIMKYLKGPECSTVKDEKIMFNNNLGAVVIEP